VAALGEVRTPTLINDTYGTDAIAMSFIIEKGGDVYREHVCNVYTENAFKGAHKFA